VTITDFWRYQSAATFVRQLAAGDKCILWQQNLDSPLFDQPSGQPSAGHQPTFPLSGVMDF
jgi:hypothetical protein